MKPGVREPRRATTERALRTVIAAGLGAVAFAVSGCSGPGTITAAPPLADTVFEDGTVRRDLRFPCQSDTCAGWLYLPPGVERPPLVVMGNGFSGTRDMAMPGFARAFAREGMAAFAFDYRCFGASGGAPRQLVDPWKQLEDWRAALAFMSTRADIDADRLAIWGTSMGGGLALVIGAESPDLSAIVAQVPGVDTDAEPEGPEVGVLWGVRLLFTAWGDLLKSTYSSEPLLIYAFAPPGEFGMLIDDQSYADLQNLVGSDSTYRNEIAARSILTFDDYNPADSWKDIQVPTLIVATKEDRLAPYEAVEAFARTNVNVTVETFDGGHFDVYLPPIADQVADIEARFLLNAFQVPEM